MKAHTSIHSPKRRGRPCGAQPGPPGPAAGFTMIEVMVVVAIIGIMAAVSGGLMGQRMIRDWRMKEASRDLFNTLVLARSTARAQGVISGIYFGSTDCGLSSEGPPWNVYSYQRGVASASLCMTGRLPKEVFFGLPSGAGVGPPDAGGGAHVADADGVALAVNQIQFNLQGFPTRLLSSTNDTVYLQYIPAGENQPTNINGRAIILRQIGRPQMWSWGVNQWNLLRHK